MHGIKRLAAGGIFALIGVAALVFSANAGDRAGYLLGLGLFAACVVMVMILVERHFSGAPDSWLPEFRPETRRNRIVLLLVLGAAALLGLFVAAANQNVLYHAGIGLFAACCVLGIPVFGALFDDARPTRRRRRR